MSCGKSTHKVFYTQTLLHMMLLHKHTLTHRRFDTQKPLHTNAFTHRRFYTQKLLHTDGFTHRRFYTQTLLHADAFYTRTHAVTHKRFYTCRHAFTHKRFYTQTPLHTDIVTQTKASIAIFPEFLTSKVHFVQKGYDGHGNQKLKMVVLIIPDK